MAIALAVALVFSSVAPGWALAAEFESEGEGTAPHGLNNPAFEPGGQEAVLENLPGLSTSAGGSEENGEGPPVESEPAVQPELPEAPPPASEVEPTAAAPSAEATPPTAPPPPAPEAEPAPEYQASAPSPPAEPVENEPLVAPPQEPAPAPSQESGNGGQVEAPSPEAVVEVPAPVAPVEPQAPAPEESAPAAVAPDSSLAGRGGLSPASSSYVVRPGDCLWSIAERLLPAGASNGEIAAKVARLWQLNADRIGTGDPNVILSGTMLRLS